MVGGLNKNKMSNELQNDEFILKGNLGSVKIGNEYKPITKVFKGKDGCTVLTITPNVEKIIITARVDEKSFEQLLEEIQEIDFMIGSPKKLKP